MYEQLKGIMVNELSIDPKLITLDAELKKGLGINSLELPELILSCEDKFGIEIDDDNISKFITVRDMVEYLESAVK